MRSAVASSDEIASLRASRRKFQPLSVWATMAEHQLQVDPSLGGVDILTPEAHDPALSGQ